MRKGWPRGAEASALSWLSRERCPPRASPAGSRSVMLAWLLSVLGAEPRNATVRIAVITDTHYWPPSEHMRGWTAASDAAGERDGLLVGDSSAVVRQLLVELQAFAADGGAFALHLGDAGCGGGSFTQPEGEFRQSLSSLRDAERLELGRWPVFHVPGNHDLTPAGEPGARGGLGAWNEQIGRPQEALAAETEARL
eukprot:5547776-Prymnesium_polylepis.1